MKNPENKNCCGGDSCCGGDNKAAAQENACCGDACDCHASSSSSISGKMRTIIGSVVLVAAALLVVRAIAKDSGSASTTDAQAFVMPAAAPATTETQSVIGTQIDSFADLNRVAAQTDAVFLFLPSKDGKLPSDAVKGAAAKIEKQGQKCGLFTLKTSSPDFAQLTDHATLPAVLVMVKGKGTIWVSGDITEEKLVQGYVAASRSGGCCSAGGSCCP